MKIYKYPIALESQQRVKMPAEAQILTLQMQNGQPCIWALVDENASLVPRTICTYGTGRQMPTEKAEIGHYIGTYQLEAGALVFHVFDRMEDETF